MELERHDLAETLAADLGTSAPGASTRACSPAAASSLNLNATALPASPAVPPPAKRARTDSGDAPASPPPNLDCYPYTFSPLLLFSSEGYFDKGYSNYNAVARFFDPVLQPRGIDMLENVLYDRKNMLYDELFEYVRSRRMFVPCCIDAHCTAFQVVGKSALLYYDPLSAHVTQIS